MEAEPNSMRVQESERRVSVGEGIDKLAIYRTILQVLVYLEQKDYIPRNEEPGFIRPVGDKYVLYRQ
jgi:hypothetical protein